MLAYKKHIFKQTNKQLSIIDYLVFLQPLHVCFCVTWLFSKWFLFYNQNVRLTKSQIVSLLDIFACFNVAGNFSVINFSNSWVVIYLESSGLLFQLLQFL